MFVLCRFVPSYVNSISLPFLGLDCVLVAFEIILVECLVEHVDIHSGGLAARCCRVAKVVVSRVYGGDGRCEASVHHEGGDALGIECFVCCELDGGLGRRRVWGWSESGGRVVSLVELCWSVGGRGKL